MRWVHKEEKNEERSHAFDGGNAATMAVERRVGGRCRRRLGFDMRQAPRNA